MDNRFQVTVGAGTMMAGSAPPRNRRLAAVGHSLTASCMHTASDDFVILKPGRPAG